MDVLRHCECEGWIGRWPYHGRNDPEGTFRCSDCERVLEEQYVRADLHRGAVDALAQIAAVLSRQETIVEADATVELRGIVGDALIAAGGQSSPTGCPACSRVPGVARPSHTCSGEQTPLGTDEEGRTDG